MKLIVGLGNPGRQYEWTRHNFGFLVVEAFAKSHGTSYRKHRTGASVARIIFGNEKVIVAKSAGFMNESGSSVAALKRFYKVRDNDLIIVHDDIDLLFGTLRIGQYTSSGGHKGVQSVIDAFGGSIFARIRLGIGPKTSDAETFVLEKWTQEEQAKLNETLNRALEAIKTVVTEGLEKAASRFNSSP